MLNPKRIERVQAVAKTIIYHLAKLYGPKYESHLFEFIETMDINRDYKKPIESQDALVEEADALIDINYYLYNYLSRKDLDLQTNSDEILYEFNEVKKFTKATTSVEQKEVNVDWIVKMVLSEVGELLRVTNDENYLF